MMLHLGMSGSLRVLRRPRPPGTHDHVDLVLDNGHLLRFNDPRRFGSIHWVRGAVEKHPLLAGLGPEPLGPDFTADYLAGACRGRKVAIKPHVMNGRIVVGVGNIYAIREGGTTLRDFAWGEGQPGYFSQALAVYGRQGEPCLSCGTPIRSIVLGQRATYFCPRCQR